MNKRTAVFQYDQTVSVIKTLKAQYLATVAERDDALNTKYALEAQLAQLQERYNATSNKAACDATDLERAQATIKVCNEQINILYDRIETLKTMTTEKIGMIDDLEAEIEQLRDSLEDSANVVVRRENIIAEMQDQIDSLQRDYDKLAAGHEMLRSCYLHLFSEKSNILKDLEAQVDNLSAELGVQYDRIAKRDQIIDELEDDLYGKTRDYDELNRDHEELKAHYNSVCRKHTLALEHIAQLKDEMDEHFETARAIYLVQDERIADLTSALGIRTAQLKKIQEAIDPKA